MQGYMFLNFLQGGNWKILEFDCGDLYGASKFEQCVFIIEGFVNQSIGSCSCT